LKTQKIQNNHRSTRRSLESVWRKQKKVYGIYFCEKGRF